MNFTFAQLPPTIEWDRSYGGTSEDYGGIMVKTANGQLLLYGITMSNDVDVSGQHGLTDGWILNMTMEGLPTWQRTLGGTDLEEGGTLCIVPGDRSLIALSTSSMDGDITDPIGSTDIWLVRMSESGDTLWQKTYGGTGSDWVNGDVLALPQAGYLLLGTTGSLNGQISDPLGDSDIWLVRLDAAGTLLWERTLGGSGADDGTAMHPTATPGYIMAGNTSSNDVHVTGNHGSYDGWVAKLDTMGSIIWARALGGSDFDFIYDVRPVNGGGYVAVGDTYSTDGDVQFNHGADDLWVVKLSEDGDLEWERTFGGSSSEMATSVHPLDDGSVLVTGLTLSSDGDVTQNNGDHDAWLLLLDDQGNMIWQRTLGSSGYDCATDVLPTNDGGYLLSGQNGAQDGDVSLNHGGSDIWLVKLMPANVAAAGTDSRDDQLAVFPNPSDGLFELSTEIIRNAARLVITDAQGRVVREHTVSPSDRIIDAGDLLPGVYVLSLFAEGARSQARICIK